MHRGISLAHVHVRFFFLLCASRTMLEEAVRCGVKVLPKAEAVWCYRKTVARPPPCGLRRGRHSISILPCNTALNKLSLAIICLSLSLSLSLARRLTVAMQYTGAVDGVANRRALTGLAERAGEGSRGQARASGGRRGAKTGRGVGASRCPVCPGRFRFLHTAWGQELQQS